MHSEGDFVYTHVGVHPIELQGLILSKNVRVQAMYYEHLSTLILHMTDRAIISRVQAQ